MGLTATKYKETEVGLIPEDWDLVPFDKVFAFHSTSNYSKAQMSDDDEVGCIHYGLIHEIPETQYNLKNGIKYYVSSDQAKYDIVRDGDVIMVDASEDLEGVNKSVEVCGIGNKKYISGLHTYLLRDTNGSLAENFRGILLNSQLVKNQMLQLAVGMKVFGVSKTQLIKVKLPLPPTLTEQKAIAHVLTDTDALIQALEKKISKKKLIKKGVMQKLLTPKAGWEVKTIEDLAECLDNTRIPLNGAQRAKMKGGIPYCGANGIVDYVNDFTIDDDVILMAEDGGYFDEYEDRPIAYRIIGKCWVNNHAHVLKAKPLFSHGFLFHSLVHKNILGYINGGTRAKLNKAEMFKIEIHIPTRKDEQNRIASILNDVEDEITVLKQKLSKYQLTKQGMIQQLLTGKTRLV